ncbi:MAG TPA: hypothetical protein VGO47_06580 [Chlamydiales bacterium]|nr:hypothetical protein [Chlamydiales bacterium]
MSKCDIFIVTKLILCRYINVDYALAGALREIGDLSVGFTYDVACQYMRHLSKRLQKNTFLSDVACATDRMIAGIGKMHQAGHKDDCTYEFGLNYLEGAGQLSGEGVETVWSESNQVNGSAKQMNPGHRHDTLDTNFNDWNWNKVIRISKSFQAINWTAYLSTSGQLLRSMLVKAYQMAHETQIYVAKMDINPVLKAQWAETSTKPYWENQELKSVYKPESFKGI